MQGKKIISTASTNATSFNVGPSDVAYVCASNTNASPRYVKIYNTAGAPTVGTDIPVHTFLVPGNASGGGTNIDLRRLVLSAGFAVAITGAAADSDTTAIGAGEVILNVGFD